VSNLLLIGLNMVLMDSCKTVLQVMDSDKAELMDHCNLVHYKAFVVMDSQNQPVDLV
jgi:hypothetical protein